MKKNAFIFIFTSIVLAGCYEKTYRTDADGLNEVLIDEKWIVKFFSVNDYDRTREFVDYQFRFSDNNVVSSFNPIIQDLKSGSYAIIGTDSTVFLRINMGVDPTYTDFNYDWEVREITSKIVRMEHGWGGNGGMSYLTFEK